MAPSMRPRSNAGAEGDAVVLVAEDELLVRKVVSASLELARYTVLVAEDGLEALEVSRSYKGTIDLLLTDMRMPRMDGETLIEIIGHERPHIKLLWMSGFQADAVSSRRRTIPFLRKPFSLQELLNAVASALREDTEKAGETTDHGP